MYNSYTKHEKTLYYKFLVMIVGRTYPNNYPELQRAEAWACVWLYLRQKNKPISEWLESNMTEDTLIGNSLAYAQKVVGYEDKDLHCLDEWLKRRKDSKNRLKYYGFPL